MDRVEAYRILGVPSTATQTEIREAYRDLAKVWHPDRFGQDARLRAKAEETLKAINEAYQLLRTASSSNGPSTSSRPRHAGPTQRRDSSKKTSDPPGKPPASPSAPKAGAPQEPPPSNRRRTRWAYIVVPLVLLAALLRIASQPPASLQPTSSSSVSARARPQNVEVAPISIAPQTVPEKTATPSKPTQVAATEQRQSNEVGQRNDDGKRIGRRGVDRSTAQIEIASADQRPQPETVEPSSPSAPLTREELQSLEAACSQAKYELRGRLHTTAASQPTRRLSLGRLGARTYPHSLVKRHSRSRRRARSRSTSRGASSLQPLPRDATREIARCSRPARPCHSSSTLSASPLRRCAHQPEFHPRASVIQQMPVTASVRVG